MVLFNIDSKYQSFVFLKKKTHIDENISTNCGLKFIIAFIGHMVEGSICVINALFAASYHCH